MRETGSPVPPSLSRGAHSGVSEPFVPLLDFCQWPLPCLLSVPFSKSGSFPRPALPGVFSTTNLSATLPARPAPHGVPVCACTLLCRASRVATLSIFRTCRRHYPGGSGSVLLSFAFPNHQRPSPYSRRVGSHIALFEACSAFNSNFGLRGC